MKLLERMNGLVSAFNIVWKICLLVLLMWIGLSLHIIAAGIYHGDYPPGLLDPTSQSNDSSENCRSETPRT